MALIYCHILGLNVVSFMKPNVLLSWLMRLILQLYNMVVFIIQLYNNPI